MKKLFFFSLFISFKMFGQTPKIDVVVGTTENIDGIRAVLKNTTPSSSHAAISGINNSFNDKGIGVYGEHSRSGIGVYGKSLDFGIGVKGFSLLGSGIDGSSLYIGVKGSSGSNYGVYGDSDSGIAGYFTSNKYALITNTGKVGFGNSTPNLNTDERVEINGRLRIRDSTSTAGVWFNNSTNGIGLDNGAFYGLETAVSGSERAGIWIGSDWRFYINRFGNANFTGTVTATGFPIASDKRYKKNIQPLENTLSKVQKIVGVSYNLRKDEFPEKNFSDKPQIAFIAQDLEKIFPEMVFTDEKGYKSVDYARLTPVLVEALKELTLKNQTLETRLDKIEAMLSTIQPNTENLNSKK